MVLFALKAWLASIFAWPALMVLYEYRRPIRRLLKNTILWVGIPAISRLFEGMGSGLMGTSLLLWLVSLQRPDLIDAKDLIRVGTESERGAVRAPGSLEGVESFVERGSAGRPGPMAQAEPMLGSPGRDLHREVRGVSQHGEDKAGQCDRVAGPDGAL